MLPGTELLWGQCPASFIKTYIFTNAFCFMFCKIICARNLKILYRSKNLDDVYIKLYKVQTRAVAKLSFLFHYCDDYANIVFFLQTRKFRVITINFSPQQIFPHIVISYPLSSCWYFFSYAKSYLSTIPIFCETGVICFNQSTTSRAINLCTTKCCLELYFSELQKILNFLR